MIIKPPSDDVIKQSTIQSDRTDHKKVTEYISYPNWKCPKCGSIISGGTLRCPYNRNGDYCHGVRG